MCWRNGPIFYDWVELYIPVPRDSYFCGYIYKAYHLGRNFQQLLPTKPLKYIVYSAQWTDCYVIIGFDDRMLQKFSGYSGQNLSVACLTCHSELYASIYHHPPFVDGKLLKRIENKWASDGIEVLDIKRWAQILRGKDPSWDKERLSTALWDTQVQLHVDISPTW